MPIIWRAFLTDQRGPRVLQGVLSTRTLSLRAASERDRQGQEARDMVRFKMEQSKTGLAGVDMEEALNTTLQGIK